MKNNLKFVFFMVYLIAIFFVEKGILLAVLFWMNFLGMALLKISLKKIWALFENINAICAIYGNFEYLFGKPKSRHFNGGKTFDGVSSNFYFFKFNDEHGTGKCDTKLSIST